METRWWERWAPTTEVSRSKKTISPKTPRQLLVSEWIVERSTERYRKKNAEERPVLWSLLFDSRSPRSPEVLNLVLKPGPFPSKTTYKIENWQESPANFLTHEITAELDWTAVSRTQPFTRRWKAAKKVLTDGDLLNIPMFPWLEVTLATLPSDWARKVLGHKVSLLLALALHLQLDTAWCLSISKATRESNM
jgi:hypothetical protein